MESERDEIGAAKRIGAALVEAVPVFGTAARAFLWLGEPIVVLNGRRPAEIAAASEEGLERVRRVLGRIDYGVYE